MALSKEEQAELQQLESELSTEAPSVQGMSAEEEAELQALESEVGQDVPMEAPREESNMLMDAASTLAAVSRKVAKGALPFNNQLSAAITTGLDYVTDPIADAMYGTSSKPESIGEKYARNLETIRGQEQEDNENLGVVGTGLEVAGAIAGFSKLSKFMDIGTKGAANIAKLGLTDAVYAGLSYTDTKGYDKDTMSVMAMGGGLSMVTQIAAGPLGKVVGAVGRTALGKADEALMGANISRYADKTVEGIEYMKSNHGKDSIKQSFDELGLSNPEFANNIPKHKAHVRKVLDEYGEKITNAYEGLDAYTGGVPIDAPSIMNDIKSSLLNNIKSNAGQKQAMDDVMPKIQAMFENSMDEGPVKTYTVKNITDLYRTIADMNKGNVLSTVEGKNKELVFRVMRDHLKRARSKVTAQLEMGVANSRKFNELTDSAEVLEGVIRDAKQDGVEASVPAFKERLKGITGEINALKKMGVSDSVDDAANRTIADPKSIQFITESLEKNNAKYAMLSDFNKKVLSNKMPSTSGGYVVNALKNALSQKGIMGAILGNAVGGKIGAMVGAAGVGMGNQAASKIGALVESYAGKTKEENVRQGLLRMGKFFRETSQYNGDPIFRALSATVAQNLIEDEDVSADQQWVNISSAMSKASLYVNPVERNQESVINSFDDIMNIAAKESPQLANSLADMMNNQEDVGPVMDTLSKSPAMAKFFKAGMGWGGRVYSEEDKATLVNEIKSQLDVPSVIKNKYINEVMVTGEIPDMNEIPRRQRMQYNPRDRKKVR